MNKIGFSLIEFMIYVMLSVLCTGLALQMFFSIQTNIIHHYYSYRCNYFARMVYQRIRQDIFFCDPRSIKLSNSKIKLEDEGVSIVWQQKGTSLYRTYHDTHKKTRHTALVARDIAGFICSIKTQNMIEVSLNFLQNRKQYTWQVANGWIISDSA